MFDFTLARLLAASALAGTALAGCASPADGELAPASFVSMQEGPGEEYVIGPLGKLGGTFATAGKLEQTFDLPVIGTISHTLTEAAQALRKRKTKQFAMASAGLGGLFVVLLGVEFVQRGMVA